MTPLRAAVVGAGAMGTNHARVYSELDSVELVGIAEPNPEAAERASKRYRTKVFPDCRQLLEQESPDLVSVAVPTLRHEEVALEVIRHGSHVLVEKPLALDVEGGVRLIKAAKAHDVKLAVGHVERFNPAVIEMKQRLRRHELGRVFQVNARRLSPFPGRIDDVGVILDLATHDIDVMRDLLGSEVDHLFAETDRRAHASCEDLVTALLRFSDGVIGVLDVNWLTPTKVRQLAVLGEGGMYVADYLTQDLFWYKNAPSIGRWDTLSMFRGAWEGDVVKIRLEKREPLRVELEALVSAIVDDSNPVVSGYDGLATIAIGRALMESGKRCVPLAPQLPREPL